jgi:hypothetical protein
LGEKATTGSDIMDFVDGGELGVMVSTVDKAGNRIFFIFEIDKEN